MTRFYLMLLLISPIVSYGQQFMNYDKSAIRDSLLSVRQKKAGIKSNITESKNELIYTIKGQGKEKTEIIYSFDSLGKCNREKISGDCDTCISAKLQSILRIDTYGWKKINENQYVSRFEDRLMIELSVNKNDHSFYIHRMSWTQILYDILVGK